MNFFRSFCASVCLLLLTPSLPAWGLEVGQSIVMPALTTLEGKTVSAQQLQGKYLIVQIWASWCPYCHKQNMNLQKLAQQLAPDKALIIGLSVDREVSQAQKYSEQHALRFTVAMMTPELAAAFGKRRGIPELYVIDPSGRVVQKDFGLMVDADLFELKKYGQ